MCLVDDVFLNIVEKYLAVGLWVKLEILYMNKSLTNIIFLKSKLYTLRMTNGMKIHDHLNTFNDLVGQLTNVDVNIDDEEKEINLLCTLPNSWDHIITSISFSNLESFDCDIVVGAVLLKEQSRKNNQENSSSVAVATRNQ